jgi:hypothetical protein
LQAPQPLHNHANKQSLNEKKDGHFHPAGKGIFVFLTTVQGRGLAGLGEKIILASLRYFYPPKPCTV